MHRLKLCLALSCFLAAISPVALQAALYDTTYIGPNGDYWNSGANWSGGVVPANTGSDQFNVTLPDNKTVDFDCTGVTDVSNLTLTDAGTINWTANGTLNVDSTLVLHGTVNISGGTFNAAAASGGSIDNAHIAASGSATVVMPASITSYSMTYNNGSYYTLFSADGAGTKLGLSALKSLSPGNVYATIAATNNGQIDLSGL